MEGILTTITVDQLRDIIRDAVRNELDVNSQKNSDGYPLKNKLVTRRKASEVLGVSDPTLIKWEKEGRIRCYRMGGKIFYDIDELYQFIRNSASRWPGGKNE